APTMSAQPSMRIGSPTGEPAASSTVARYAGFSSSGRWCSAVGYSHTRLDLRPKRRPSSRRPPLRTSRICSPSRRAWTMTAHSLNAGMAIARRIIERSGGLCTCGFEHVGERPFELDLRRPARRGPQPGRAADEAGHVHRPDELGIHDELEGRVAHREHRPGDVAHADTAARANGVRLARPPPFYQQAGRAPPAAHARPIPPAL